MTLISRAQSNVSAWTEPVNLSKSGGATQPVMTVSADGKLHAIWWDVIDGEQYAYTTGVSNTDWTQPIGLAQIVGERQVNANTGQVSLTPPHQLQVQADVRGNVYAFWLDANNQLLGAQTQSTNWSGATSLAAGALAFDVAADVSGTVRLALINPIGNVGTPAGVYARSTTGNSWGTAVLVFASPYFRTAQPETTHISVAGNGQGQSIVIWDDPRLNQSFYATSKNNGATWSAAQSIIGTDSSRVSQAQAASAANGDLLMFWQDFSAGGCSLTQTRSSDGGLTWSIPERVLSSLTICTGQWTFTPGSDGRTWLTIQAAINDQTTSSVTVAAWDGQNWSAANDVNFSFFDANTQQTINLGCLSIGLTGSTAGIVGCDDSGDIWAARNAAQLNQLVPASQSVWSKPLLVSDLPDTRPSIGQPALTIDANGHAYALWSQNSSGGLALYAAGFDGQHWSRAVKVLAPFNSNTSSVPTKQDPAQAVNPALTLDTQGRLQAVWSSGAIGEILYSSAYTRDVTLPPGWSTPIVLPAPSSLGSAPDIVADTRGKVLYVLYAIAYNEARGVYLDRSLDGGSTWLAPIQVFDAAAAHWDSLDQPRLALDPASNILHAVWLKTSLSNSAEPQAIYYARSIDQGLTWSTPLKVAEGQVTAPRLAVMQPQQILLAWTQMDSRANRTLNAWSQFSPDGGSRWSDPAAVHGFENVNGPIDLATDGSQVYLLGTGQLTSNEGTLLAAHWAGADWSDVDSVPIGQPAVPGNAATGAIGGQHLNTLLRAWMSDRSGGGDFAALATDRTLPVSAPITPAPTFTPMPTPIPAPTSMPTATPKPRVLSNQSQPKVSTGLLSNFEPLILPAILVAAIALFALSRAIVTRRR
jgi:hypothetical protein